MSKEPKRWKVGDLCYVGYQSQDIYTVLAVGPDWAVVRVEGDTNTPRCLSTDVLSKAK